MEKGTIITLDDNSEYALLDDTIINEKKYFFAVKVDINKNPTTSYEVFVEVYEDGEYFIDVLDESDFKQSILLDFSNNYMKKVGESIKDNNVD